VASGLLERGAAARDMQLHSRDAGDIILLDNSFASLVTSIETGRLLSDNIKKVCLYLLPAGSWAELMPFLANIWLGVPLALTSFLAIAFCVFNDVCNALALVNEPPEKNIMERPPVIRNKERLVNGRLLLQAYLFIGTLETLSAFFCFCWYWTDQGYPVHDLFLQYSYFGTMGPDLKDIDPDLLAAHLAVSQSIYYASLVILQFFNLISTRTRYESFFCTSCGSSTRQCGLWHEGTCTSCGSSTRQCGLWHEGRSGGGGWTATGPVVQMICRAVDVVVRSYRWVRLRRCSGDAAAPGCEKAARCSGGGTGSPTAAAVDAVDSCGAAGGVAAAAAQLFSSAVK
jgi:hypothetical protein